MEIDEQTIFNERAEREHSSEPDLEIFEVKEKCCFCPYIGNKTDLCFHIANARDILGHNARSIEDNMVLMASAPISA